MEASSTLSPSSQAPAEVRTKGEDSAMRLEAWFKMETPRPNPQISPLSLGGMRRTVTARAVQRGRPPLLSASLPVLESGSSHYGS